MGPLLLLVFIGVPLIEIAVLIQIGGWIGLWPTLGLIILTAIVGSMELRSQGLATVARLREQLDRGELPAQTLFDGVCLLFAGALLLTPGFVTDILGMALFLPPFRRVLRVTVGHKIAERAEVHMAGRDAHGGFHSYHKQPGEDVVDAEYRDVTPDEEPEDGAKDPAGRRIPR
jgi:UPF0716 protein FxsA